MGDWSRLNPLEAMLDGTVVFSTCSMVLNDAWGPDSICDKESSKLMTRVLVL